MLHLYAMIVLLSFGACKNGKEATTTTPAPQEIEEKTTAATDKDILGEWVWLKTSCCFRMPEISTPKTKGYTRKLDFDKNGTVKQYKDKKLEWEKPYTVGKEMYRTDQPTIRIGENRLTLYYIKGDTLVLDQGYMDLQTEYWVRP